MIIKSLLFWYNLYYDWFTNNSIRTSPNSQSYMVRRRILIWRWWSFSLCFSYQVVKRNIMCLLLQNCLHQKLPLGVFSSNMYGRDAAKNIPTYVVQAGNKQLVLLYFLKILTSWILSAYTWLLSTVWRQYTVLLVVLQCCRSQIETHQAHHNKKVWPVFVGSSYSNIVKHLAWCINY